MLSAARVRGWAIFACALQAVVLAIMVAGTHGWIVAGVKPNTVDYASFYAAGVLADRGQAALAYDQAAHWQVEESVTSPGVGYEYFFNPPPFLLVMAPMAALLPYLASFLIFQGVTLTLWLAVGSRIAGGGMVTIFCLLAVPSVWWVLGEGQNTFLTASLLGGGLLLLPTRKVAAGVLFGLLCYKPHFGLLLPVALLAGGEWVAMVAAGTTVLGCVGLTLLLFGSNAWIGFADMARHSLQGAIDSGKVLQAARVDPTGALQEMGMPVLVARALWLTCFVAAAACVAVTWRKGAMEVRNATLVACAVIAAPFTLFYDLVLCSLSAAWLARAGRQDGFLRGEAGLMIGTVLADLLAAPPVVGALHLPFGFLPAPVLLALSMRRWRRSTLSAIAEARL